MEEGGTGYIALLRNRRFLLWQFSSDSANVGYSVYAITILWIAYRISNSLVLAGLVLSVEILVYTLTFLFAPLVDRARDKRTIFLVCYPLLAATAAALGIEFLSGTLTVPELVALVAILAVLWDVAWAAQQVVPRLIVGANRLFAASGISGIVSGGNQIAGYALGGALILFVGPGQGALLYAALLGVASVLSIPLALPAPPAESVSFRHQFREGWKAFRPRSSPSLIQLGLQELASGFVTQGPALLITLSANRLFPTPALSYGVLFTSYIVGEVAASLTLGSLNPRSSIGKIIILGLLGTGVFTLLATTLAPVLALASVAWILAGFAVNARFTARLNYMQGRFPPEILARLSANLYVFSGAASATGAIVLANLSTLLPPHEFGWVVASCFLVAGVVAASLPGVRRLTY